MYKLTLIARYLLRRRITHFAIAAVALCVFIVVVVMTVMTGLVGEFKQKNHAFVGDCVVGTDSLVGFPYYEEFMTLVEQSGLVQGVSPVVKNFALLSSDSSDIDRDVEILGIDPVRHSQATDFGQTLHYRQADVAKAFVPKYDVNVPGCVLGIDLVLVRTARSQYIEYDEPTKAAVTLTCVPLTAKGAPAQAGTSLVRMKRFFYSDHSRTGLARVDDSIVYLPLEEAQLLCMDGQDKRIGALHIKFRPEVKLEEGCRRIGELWREFRQAREGAPNSSLLDEVAVQSWKEYRRAFIAPMEKEQVLMSFMFILVGITTVFIVFVVFYMIVSNKRKDIGILKSVGASNTSILSLFSGFALCIGLLGSLAGNLVGCLFLARINQIEQWSYEHFGVQLWDRTIYVIDDIPNRVDPALLAVITGCALLSCLIGALVPSFLAARLRPVETLHAGRT